ncbi:MAG: hypothetical protein GX970_13950 [Phyllobacteriaceae bacterium]|nr:hypothetical protein [Phyllobacteriaceae bacterium]
MPYIHIDWITQNQEKRDEVSKRVATAVNEVTGIALNDIWVVFKDIDAENWYVGDRSVAKIRAEAKK